MTGTLRVLGVVALTLAGAVAIVACLLALDFEISGFGRASDTPVRPMYAASLVAGAVAGVLVPAAAALAWLGRPARVVTLVLGSVALLAVVSFLGLKVF